MTERLSLNNQPEHQLAKQHLKLLKQPQNPDSLYAVQLALWGLENLHPLRDVNAELQRPALERAASALLSWKPENAQLMLANEEKFIEHREFRKSKSGAKEYAHSLIEDLFSNLQKGNPALRPASGL